MSNRYLQLRRIAFSGPNKMAELTFSNGVNVICGASDTGKSFLAESIDFMLGGSELRGIPERTPFGEIQFDLDMTSGEQWRFYRASSGGNFKARNLLDEDAAVEVLKKDHSHGKTDNVSGFLLDKIGLLGKRILRSKKKGTTQSLSFRNLARLVIVQEGEIQQIGSPFWGGQYTLKTAELATIKLLLSGVDDSDVVETTQRGTDSAKQIELIDELLAEIRQEIADLGEEDADLKEQIGRLDETIEHRRENLKAIQSQLDSLLEQRRELVDVRTAIRDRLDEIVDLLARFDLLLEHYAVDIERLTAIQESGAMFAHVESVPCPLCGASPQAQQHDAACDGDVEAIVQAATAEIAKIVRLKGELQATVAKLKSEAVSQEQELLDKNREYENVSAQIQETVAPTVSEERASFSELIEKRAEVQRGIDLYARAAKLEERRIALEQDEGEAGSSGAVVSGLPDSVAHDFSLRIAKLLKAWDFPGDCFVHFDKETTDFVIDGKPRGSRGKGLRAITHAAVSIALLEYCLENDLPHPGFVVLDSPLLAYFKPEGDEDRQLQGTNLKESFYAYLVDHHSSDSQIVIVENQHPPDSVLDRLSMTVFTGNPNDGRKGFL
ncbi:AAA family ATPase [Marinobacter adhaerens]|uniref:AAA family ATPase n=1 Tax=Marinobacter TaxID=2742 RepID=UPI001C5D1CD7|nr:MULTISPECIES: AAA family ATPase [Marinobacter]MBW4979742.1 AAA family ATPase [Marinobacter adhaerens]MBY6073101.1 AAA family ATPase [Marinobacter salsuginis]MDC8456082.1 AAA family ATPase [Marinobacter sp. DS40M6]MDM8179014.1 AAA family ATPase [Marinobacter salarius]